MSKVANDLRRWADESESNKRNYAYPSTIACIDLGLCDQPRSGENERKAFHILADEIERYYIPLPRFEDGEAVKDGTETEYGTVRGIAVKFHGMDSLEKGYVLLDTLENDYVCIPLDEPLKRSTSNVYDADGVPTEKGHTVFDIEACKCGSEYWSKPLTVLDVSRTHITAFQDSENLTVSKPAEIFTHKKPVFDADGVRILKGDTVWDTKGYKGTVKDIKPDVPQVIVERGLNDRAYLTPDVLTHREPDSLSNILADMIDDRHMDGTSYIPRIQSLIERGA